MTSIHSIGADPPSEIRCFPARNFRPVPSRIVFLTLYSQLTFPFLMKNLVTTLLLEDKEQFSVFIREWKRNVLSQMACLLCPQDENGDV